jgi:hypothetical protein
MDNNINIYKIAEEKINKLALNNSLIVLAVIFILPIVLFISFSLKLDSGNRLLLLFSLSMGALSYYVNKLHLQFVRFTITDKFISQTIDKNNSNQFFELILAIRRDKGVKDEKTIMFDKIESVTIKSNGDIVVKSTEHNFIYKDATITIPAQVEDYETVKNLIQKKYAFIGKG